MSNWQLVEFKNAGPDSMLRMEYKDRTGRTRVKDMTGSWRRIQTIDARGQLVTHNLSDQLKERGFVAVGQKRVSLDNFSGPCHVYRVELYGALRQDWYLRTTGRGYAYAIYWNFKRLQHLVKKLEALRAKERRYLSHIGQSGAGIPTEKEFDSASRERFQHSLFFRHLVKTDPVTKMYFVSIPGFPYVTDEDHRATLVRLYKILSEWPWKQSPPKGPRRGTRLQSTEKTLVRRHQESMYPTAMARRIEKRRLKNIGTSVPKKIPVSEALVKQVRREVAAQRPLHGRSPLK